MKCGLLGEKLGHSYSTEIHASLANYDYHLYETAPSELGAFLLQRDWDGLNVTIPYKKAVMPYCTELSETAIRCGSVNTLLRLSDGGIRGDNTDAYGFAYLLRRLSFDPFGKKALILGNGGAAAMVSAVLRSRGAREIITVSRSGANNYENIHLHYDAEFLVNATPVGMFPNNGNTLVSLQQFQKCEAVADLIYNPMRSALLMEAEKLGVPCVNGLGMLVAQAKRSCELFLSATLPDSEVVRIEKQLETDKQNIVLIGMPGCGKSTIGALLSEATGRALCESDSLVEKSASLSIPEIFRQEAEAGFRKRETAALADLGKQSGRIIATGGGCVTCEENYPLLHQNGRIIWLQREIDKLPKEGRPISMSVDLKELYEQRLPLYRRFADCSIINDGPPEETVDLILKQIRQKPGL